MTQTEAPRRRGGTIRAKIVEYLEAGWTDLDAMWTAMERENRWLHVEWSYLRRVAREWRQQKGTTA